MLRALQKEIATTLQRPWELLLLLVLPPLAMIAMGAMLIGGTVRHIPVGLVDDSHSAFGRSVERALAANSTLDVHGRTQSLRQAWAEMRTGALLAVVYLPPDVETRVRHRSPDAVLIYENSSFNTAAAMAVRAARNAVTAKIGDIAPRLAGLPAEVAEIGAAHRPAGPQVQVTFVGNPQLSLEQFLGSLVVPGILLLLASCAAIGAVGREMLEKTPRPWGAGGWWTSIGLLTARLAPTVVIYTLWMWLWTGWLAGYRGFQPTGSLALILVANVLLITATCGIAALLVGATGDPDTSYSVSTVYAGSSIAFSNGTLPLVHGPIFARCVSDVIPLSHFIRVQNGQWTLGMPVGAVIGDLALLVAYSVIPPLLGALLLRRRASKPGKEEALPPAARDEGGFAAAYLQTLTSMVRSRPLFSLFLLSVVAYAFYYPSAYTGQTARDLPVVVLDEEGTALSRRFVRLLDATESVAVTQVTTDGVVAMRLLHEGRVMGLVTIPTDFSRQLAHGQTAGIAVTLDGGYLVRASAVGDALSGALPDAIRQSAEEVLGMTLPGQPPQFGVTSLSMFNTVAGYGSYVVPGVMSIILQQTLLFGTATLAGFRREAWGTRRRGRRPGWKMGVGHYLGTWAALSTVGFCTNALYWGFVLWFNDFPRGGNIAGALWLSGWFAAAVAALGLLVGSVFDRHDRAVYVLAGTSVPFFFLGGLAVPHFAMPDWLVALAWPIPSTVAVPAFVEINGAGATSAEIAPYTVTLIVLALVYGAAAGWRWCAAGPVRPLLYRDGGRADRRE